MIEYFVDDDRRIINEDDEQVSSSSSSFGPGGTVSGDSLLDDGEVSDCESVVCGNYSMKNTSIEVKGLVKLDEGDRLCGIIGKKFVARLGEIGIRAQVECIRRNMFNGSVIDQARLRSFQIYAKAVERRNGGDANVKYGWFGGLKAEIDKVVLNGFGYDNVGKDGLFENGIVLSADHSPLESVEAAIADEDGIKHILLCRVLLGKTELVTRGSTQSHPSSEEFQSGVDDLVSPKKYMVWSSQMNTHILPEFVISFKTSTSMNNSRPLQEYDAVPKLDGVPVRTKKPVSPWIPIPDLIAALSKILPPKSIKEITQFRRSYIEHKISRRDMIRGIRQITGDRLLLTVLKNFNEKRRGNRLG